ncbi:alpha/beta fold hydrolase [Streptomyces sp. NBC_00728]|jgi:Predicted hydrolases or acyltransferases (alpha/beta hydrolase superfamily)|uniref:alpha/beta fold hydrolase n=1 Tax=Streptomyces sp. NBC_00728 TaxID=2903676 RepID=UPI003867AE01
MRMTVPTPLGDIAVRCFPPFPGARPEGASVPPGAPALLLLHANPGDGRDFAAVLPALADRYRTFVVDWPGYGDSTAPEPGRVTPEGLVEVAELVLDALAEEQGVREVAVLGNSVGGYVACRLAEGPRAASVSALVLVDPAGFTRHTALTRWFCREVMGRPARARRLVVPLARAYLGRLGTPSARETYARVRQLPHDERRLAVHCAVWRGLADPGFGLADPAAPDLPILLLWGSRDPVVPALLDRRRAQRMLPAGTLSVLLPTAHEPYNERPGLFLRHVLPFLEDPRAVGGRRLPSRPRRR